MSEQLTVGRIAFERTGPGVIRVVKANETPAAKMQRLMDAAFRKYAQEFPAQALEIVRQEVLDKRVVK